MPLDRATFPVFQDPNKNTEKPVFATELIECADIHVYLTIVNNWIQNR